LPFTGGVVALKGLVGVFLIAFGVVMLGAARRRHEIERLLWPDER
jgi:hypothetical protein